MKRIKFMVDTAADMPEELIEKYDLANVNFIVNFGEESFIAREEISNAEFYKKMCEGKVHPKTAQTPYQTLYDALLAEAKNCETLIYYTLSSKASGQFQTATLISKELMEENPELDIRVVDTGKFSYFTGIAIEKAVELEQAGKSADDIIKESVDYMNRYEVFFVVDDLNFLQKGGRIRKSTAVLGSMLDLKPVLGIRDGLIESITTIRGKKKVCKKLIDLLDETEGFNPDTTEFFILHSGIEGAEELQAVLTEKFGSDKLRATIELGAIIGTHTGPGVKAVVFRKTPQA